MSNKKEAAKTKRKTIPKPIQRQLIASCGGFCQNPRCNIDLFRFFEDGAVTSIDELAHIISAGDTGPKRNENISTSDLNLFENIIILCPTCHTIVDKSPEHFPALLLRDWKTNHVNAIRALFAIPTYGDRVALAHDIRLLLARNKRLFDQWGPLSLQTKDPLSDAYLMWEMCVESEIIPNNDRISDVLAKNSSLLNMDEVRAMNKFRLHKDGFKHNHLSEIPLSSVPTFPPEMNQLFKEIPDNA